MTALLLDDEKRAVALLKKLLEETGVFTQIRHAYNVEAALDAVKKNVPDVIFLDIKMPNKDGFTFLEELKKLNIQTDIVFVTAFDQYTHQAIKHHAFDYLMKPVDRQELHSCLDAFLVRKQKTDFSSRLGRFLEEYETHKKIRFNTRTGFFQVAATEIIMCVADGNYTHIHTADTEQLCTLNLGNVEERLPSIGFLRLGRSHIININYIYKVDRKAAEILFEKNGKKISLSLSNRQIRELDKLM